MSMTPKMKEMQDRLFKNIPIVTKSSEPSQDDSYERQVIEFESERNGAMDRYFNARSLLPRNPITEQVFEAGFRMAWEFMTTKQDK